MGYCMGMTNSKFIIKKDNFDKALAALKTVFLQEDKMTCQDYICGEYIPHFSWVNTANVLSSLTLDEALIQIRYIPVYGQTGDIVNVEFMGEKYGDEKIFFTALAPFVEQDSYIDFVGEDGAQWKWYFDGQTVEYQDI